MATLPTCVICCAPVHGCPRFEFCCTGIDPVTQEGCGCFGQPIHPCVCSDRCYDATIRHIGIPFEERRVKAGIPLWKPEDPGLITKELFSVFTVGNEANYDRGLIEQGQKFKKLGRTREYSGGFALRTSEDAERLIDEQGKRGEWAVYALAADWEKDTVPSLHGWWHALVNTSLIVCKIPDSSVKSVDKTVLSTIVGE